MATAEPVATVPEPSVTGVLWDGQTYRNLGYLLLSFVLGIAYFVFLTTGISLGLGLSVIWVGVPVLVLVGIAWWKLAAFERRMAGHLLGVSIVPPAPVLTDQSRFRRCMHQVRNPLTWKSLLYLLLKFPLGIVSFVLTVSLLSVSVSLLAVPFLFQFVDMTVGPFPVDDPVRAIFFGVVGAFIGVWSLHGLNAWSRVCGWIARKLLSAPVSEPPGTKEEPSAIAPLQQLA